MAAITGRVLNDAHGQVVPMGHEVRQGDYLFTASSPCPYRDVVVFEVLGFEQAEKALPECITIPFSETSGQTEEPWIELFLPQPGTVYVAIEESDLEGEDGLLVELAHMGWRHCHGCKILFEQLHQGTITEPYLFSKDFCGGRVELTSPAVGAVFVALEKPNLMVTLSIASVETDGCLHIDCRGLGGDLLATLRQRPDTDIASIKAELASRLLDAAYPTQGERQVKCLTVDARVLDSRDSANIIYPHGECM